MNQKYMNETHLFLKNMNRHVNSAQLMGEKIGRVLWIDVKYDQGIIIENDHNEYFFNPSGTDVITNQLVRFNGIKIIRNQIALDVRDFLIK